MRTRTGVPCPVGAGPRFFFFGRGDWLVIETAISPIIRAAKMLWNDPGSPHGLAEQGAALRSCALIRSGGSARAPGDSPWETPAAVVVLIRFTRQAPRRPALGYRDTVFRAL